MAHTNQSCASRYYKRFNIPELDMISAPLENGALTWHYANNTLVVSYQKPREIVEVDLKDKQDRKKMTVQKDGDVNCNQQ